MSRADCYYSDGSPRVCPECGHTEFTETVMDFIDFGVPGGDPPTEVQYNCAKCDAIVAYWAYGGFDPAFSGAA